MPKKQAWSKINMVLDRTGWMPVPVSPKTGSFHFRKAGYLACVRIQDNESDNDETIILCKVSEEG